ncbi:putative reverse transcriptase, RNA-dependent DNA polymerase [Tanacetum coccineum]|uniref:Reverse transcriptase, RNA-dependent DNA polymerase n=1 Tax=Tanacetum coccineum TaxID=301880 RepID=A0ABQ4X8M7_9ASTR
MNALSFYKMETDEISERYIAPCFVNGLKAYDGKINLAFDENLISNEFAIKLCLDYEMKKRKKFVKKELIVAFKGELYFVKFIIKPEEDDFEPGVILGRSFLRLAKGVVDFGSEFGEELPPFICKMGKSNHKKKQAMENRNLFYQDIRPSSLAGDKVELDGKTLKEDEEAVKRIKGEALKEKDDPSAFIFPIRLEGKVNENALADTGSDINTMPYRIYKTLGREEIKKIDRGITMINHTQAEAMGKLSNVLCLVGVTTIIAKFLILDIPIDRDAPIVVGRGFLYTIGSILNTPERLFSTFDGVCHQTFRATRFDVLRTAESDSDDEEEYVIKRNKFGAPIYGPKPAPYLNCTNLEDQSSAIQTSTGILIIRARIEEESTRLWRTEIRWTDPLWEQTMMRPDPQDPNDQDMKPWKSLMSVCVDDELQTQEVIKYRLAWTCHQLTLLEFARKLSISQEHNLSLSRIHTSTTTWRPILRVIYKMITYGLYQRTTGYDGYKVLFVDFKVLTEDVVRSLSTQVYCRDLDLTTLRDLIDSDGKLIPEDPEPGVPRVERMEYRQSYYWDKYHGVFEHMAGVYSVPLPEEPPNPPAMLNAL